MRIKLIQLMFVLCLSMCLSACNFSMEERLKNDDNIFDYNTPSLEEEIEKIRNDSIAPKKPYRSSKDNTKQEVTPKEISNVLVDPALPYRKNILEVHYIDVGNAGAQLIRYIKNEETNEIYTLLIDAGDVDDEKMLVNYFDKLGISTIDILVLSHPHSDHIGSAAKILRNFKVGKLFMPPVTTTTKTFENLLDEIEKQKLTIVPTFAGTPMLLHTDLDISVIGPVNPTDDDLNNASIVLRLVHDDISFAFTGDAEKESEELMIKNGSILKTNIWLAAHHGSSTSSHEILSLAQPEYVVIQSSKGNEYQHPHDLTLRRIAQINASVLRNDELGHIVITTDGKTIDIETERR